MMVAPGTGRARSRTTTGCARWATSPNAAKRRTLRPYVANLRDDTVSVIDTATLPPSVVATIPVGAAPDAVAVTPDGKHAYVANLGSNSVSVIDTASNMVTATVVVGAHPIGVAVAPDGKHAYVANANSNTVSVTRTATNTVVATVPVGSAPEFCSSSSCGIS